jgi:hypothetical protein
VLHLRGALNVTFRTLRQCRLVIVDNPTRVRPGVVARRPCCIDHTVRQKYSGSHAALHGIEDHVRAVTVVVGPRVGRLNLGRSAE